MGRPPGTKADCGEPEGNRAGRLVGFAMLAGLAGVILAGVVLVPAYNRYAWARYERDCHAADVEDFEAAVAAHDRLIEGMPRDEVLAKRMAMSRLGVLPGNEMVVVDPDRPPALPPGVVVPAAAPRPSAPPAWLGRLAGKLEMPSKRRGLMVLAVALLVTAVYLFAPGRWRQAD